MRLRLCLLGTFQRANPPHLCCGRGEFAIEPLLQVRELMREVLVLCTAGICSGCCISPSLLHSFPKPFWFSFFNSFPPLPLF